MKNSTQNKAARATLKSCKCANCGTGYTIVSAYWPKSENMICDECDFEEATEEFLAERREDARRLRNFA